MACSRISRPVVSTDVTSCAGQSLSWGSQPQKRCWLAVQPDDLGTSFNQPHLVKGPGFEHDPAFLASPTGSLNDAPFQMHYTDLDPEARYKVRVVYSDLQPQIRVRLVANDGIEVHPFILKKHPRQPMEFDVPQEATRGGELTLTWHREPGRGASAWGVKCLKSG